MSELPFFGEIVLFSMTLFPFSTLFKLPFSLVECDPKKTAFLRSQEMHMSERYPMTWCMIYLEHLGHEKPCFCVLNLVATDLLNTISMTQFPSGY